MTTITPTRFGLKYAPIPTLALEYEEDLGVVEDESGTRSLYVLKETPKPTRHVRKKLHVVELPHLTGLSEAQTIVQQLQKDDHRFLGPSVVKEQQLRRLLQQLVDQLRSGDSSSQQRGATRVDEDEDEDDGLAESAMGESIAEASMSMDVSKAKEESREEGDAEEDTPATRQRGKFITQDDDEEEEEEEEEGADASTHEEDHEPGVTTSTRAPATEDDRLEAEEDEKKKKALKSDSGGSENEEEDVQSEELEYFSEDGSDEDSF